MNVDEILWDEARTMGRDVTLVAAHVFELEVPVAVVVYDCAPLETTGIDGKAMHERRVAVRSGGEERANTSMIVSIEWKESA